MFEVGKKVVCLINFKGLSVRGNLIKGVEMPKEGDILIVSHIKQYKGETILYFNEISQRNGFYSIRFRPIDYSYGEELAESIEEEINQEQLVELEY